MQINTLLATPSSVVSSNQKQKNKSKLEMLLIDFITKNPRCSKRALRELPGNNSQIDDTVASLLQRGVVINQGNDRAHRYLVAPQPCPTGGEAY